MIQLALTQIEVTSFGLAELSIGALISFAPRGAINPPRLLGWIALASGAAALIAGGVIASDVFFVFYIINSLGTLVLLFGLGGWLIMNRRLSPPRTATPSMSV